MPVDPQQQQLGYALGVALASALGSAVGIIGLLVKWVLDSRRQRNGHGHLTRDEFNGRLTTMKEQIDDRTDGLKEQISEMKESQRELREDINVMIGSHDLRLVRLEDRRVSDARGGTR